MSTQLFNPLDFPICLNYPHRLKPSTWIEHVPFAMFVIDVQRPETVVELGTFLGTSYCAFCQAVDALRIGTRCFAVDTWKGDEQSGYFDSEILHDLRSYHDPLYGHFSRLVESTFDEAVEHFRDASIDLLHIDGFHTYSSVKHDFETWLPKVSNRGIILLHDIDVREEDFGAWKFWEEIRTQYPSFEFFHGHGLGVVMTGQQHPITIDRIINASEQEKRIIREFFYQLGLRLSHDLKGKALQSKVDEQLITVEQFKKLWRIRSMRVLYRLLTEGFVVSARHGISRLRQTKRTV
jgi:hypothetical protein